MVHIGSVNSSITARPMPEMIRQSITDIEKQAFVPLRSPMLMVFPQTTCTPAEIRLPKAAKISSTGEARP